LNFVYNLHNHWQTRKLCQVTLTMLELRTYNKLQFRRYCTLSLAWSRIVHINICFISARQENLAYSSSSAQIWSNYRKQHCQPVHIIHLTQIYLLDLLSVWLFVTNGIVRGMWRKHSRLKVSFYTASQNNNVLSLNVCFTLFQTQQVLCAYFLRSYLQPKHSVRLGLQRGKSMCNADVGPHSPDGRFRIVFSLVTHTKQMTTRSYWFDRHVVWYS
jgi:hypothetical protein